MRLLLDHCVDVHLAALLAGHETSHTSSLGWERLGNGKLLDAAEEAGFEVLLTVDKNVRFQQNLSKRHISLITLNPILVDYVFLVPLVGALLTLLDEGVPPGSNIVIEP